MSEYRRVSHSTATFGDMSRATQLPPIGDADMDLISRAQDHYRQAISNELKLSRDTCAMPGTIGQDLSSRSNCHYYFAVCELCFLIATILESHEDCNNIAYRPICLEKLSLILLRPNEIFQCQIKCVHGINLVRIRTISPELGPLQRVTSAPPR
jgi:hypothetical protein